MSELIVFNKPYGVLTQFRKHDDRPTLADFFSDPDIHPCGRLDQDSEGLLLLTADGALNARITHPRFKLPKTYWAQVDGEISEDAVQQLARGVILNDGLTLPARARKLAEPALWPRNPPVRYRAAIPTSWVELEISEGRNRQVRRMTAAVGFPTLRLVRVRIGDWSLDGLMPGEFRRLQLESPARPRPSGRLTR